MLRLVSCFTFAVACATAHAGTIIVTNNQDAGAGSLRQALIDANPGDTIGFAASGLTGGQTINLTTVSSGGGITTALSITKNITITGAGALPVSIVSGSARVFNDKADFCYEHEAGNYDQRGPNFPREWNGAPDMGAVETGPVDIVFRSTFEVPIVCS